MWAWLFRRIYPAGNEAEKLARAGCGHFEIINLAIQGYDSNNVFIRNVFGHF